MTTHTISPAPPPLRERLARATRNRWAPLPIVLTGTFMVVLDFFIVNVALPSMQARLHASSQTIEWVAAGYALTSAVFLVTAGRLGDRFGRRRIFTVGLALFTLSSALCGFAPDATILIIGRLLQGIAGALLMTNVLSLISVLYNGADRARAISAYGLVMGLAAATGQLIGGALVQWNPAGLDWRSCFLINIPVGVIGVLLAGRLVPESKASRAPRTDPVGTALLTAGLLAIVLPLVQARALGWPLWTWLTLAAAPVLLGGFVVHQRARDRRGGEPLLTLSLFADRTFSAGVVVQLAFWCGQASFFLVLALYLQQGRGLSALHSGLVFTLLALTYLIASAKAPELTERYGRRVLGAGALVLAGGHALLLATVAHFGTGGSVFVLAPGLLLVGAGMGLGIAPLATIVLASVPPEHAGAASGTLTTMQNVGNALGVAIIGVIYFGTVHSGFAPAFEWSVGALAVILAGVAALSRLLPSR
ncbi:MAG TPA: MFS transporter [Solirubrobacteraceae bacterium]|nr:MFS transporter [Solirubrobacteraceae bacterium]